MGNRDREHADAEWIGSVYLCSKEFLHDITPVDLRGDRLAEYFDLKKTFQSKNDIVHGLLGALQNRQMAANVIGFRNADRGASFARILVGFDDRSILDRFDEQSLYVEFCNRFPVARKDCKNNLWRQYTRSVISAARFMTNFASAEDFDQFVEGFSYNEFSHAALPMLLSQEIYGLGFALACDFLKELGYPDYPKPDVHIIGILSDLGLCEANKYSAYKAVIRMSKVCEDTPYNIDKTLWLIGSGNYHLHGRRRPGRKKEFIQMMLGGAPCERHKPSPILANGIS